MSIKKVWKNIILQNVPGSILSFVLIIIEVINRPIKSLEAISTIKKINIELKEKNISTIFFDRFAMHYGFSESIVHNYFELGGKFLYITCDESHMLFQNNQYSIKPYYISGKSEIFLRFIGKSYIVTPASHFSLHSKSRKMKIAHYFHSPVSMHYVYGDRAFDAYDVFFEVGPHHTREIRLLTKSRKWKNKRAFHSGYPKIDNFSLLYKEKKTDNRITKIAFAPSWLKTSVLRSHGQLIIGELISHGFHVILRPHKHSFDFDQDIIEKIVNKFPQGSFVLDTSIGLENVLSCDILISDWSGVAYEYSFSTLKPVLFIDIPGLRKIQCIENIRIDAPALEDVGRKEIGVICAAEDVLSSIKFIKKTSQKEWEEKIKGARLKYLYNFGSSAENISRTILKLSESL